MGLDRAFLSLLNARVTLTRHTGEDQFGNAAYGAPVTGVRAYVGDLGASFGTVIQDQQESTVVFSTDLITDALGIKVRDQITLPDGTITYVSAVTTAKDEVGADLYQTCTVTNTERG